jgi:GrpB-like predicted nucleotidyltransferase (UPF0157 family)
VSEFVEIAPYDPAWPTEFALIGRLLRQALGAAAVRIDHIGSTAVPGLAAKPVIDVQVTVRSFEPLDAYRAPLAEAGFVYRADNPDRTKRYFREPSGSRRTHIHVRLDGSFSQQLNLLFRDFLRADAPARDGYADLKRRCAERFRDDRVGYVDAKGPFVWDVLRRASEWHQRTGWAPGPSDA